VSSLGKGITSASIGLILKSSGVSARLQKLDPYLNVDPGTMNPYQHGEVYVTDDGCETDLDLGHYERFTGDTTTRDCNFTSGAVYNTVITKERHGEYLGGTVQMIPHITDEIKARIRKLGTPAPDPETGQGVRPPDVVICEIGGTVGDIEGLPFLEAIRQLGMELGRSNRLFIHLTLVPYIRAAGEVKTKPTQHSVGRLREIGILPDLLICRTERVLSDEVRAKIALFCNVPSAAVIEEPDVRRSIYEVPFMFVDQGLDRLIANHLNLNVTRPKLDEWRRMLDVVESPEDSVRIAVVGKYAELQDAYKSIYEAIAHGGVAHRCHAEIVKVFAEEVEAEGAEAALSDVDGILVPGGFGLRGVEGKIQAVHYAREQGVPFLGICLGLHCAVVEFARHVCGLENANSTESDPTTPHPVICLMEEQKEIEDKGATMRLGAYPCRLAKDTRAYAAYGTDLISERHRHRYEFNNEYRETMAAKGMVFSGLSPDGELVEMIELAGHPWFVATQAHPEFKSRPVDPHPLFRDLVRTALDNKRRR